jgi:predicted phosphodiesterase
MLDFALCQSSKPSIAIMCHYPLKSGPNDKNPLQKESSLQQVLLKDPRVKLYVHGHNHRQSCFAVEHIHCASAGLIRSKFGEYNIYTFTDEQVNILLKNTEKGSL